AGVAEAGDAQLQRSRALSSAEIRPTSSRSWTPRASFNGAALFRARRCNGVVSAATAPSGFNGAALFRARRSRVDRLRSNLLRRASTEPRSFERGDPERLRARTRTWPALQRSRALSSAEISRAKR